MNEVDEVRPLTAGRVLAIWRESREEAEDPLERVLLSNASVLAESCFFQGEPAFADAKAVLERLTGRQMEELLQRLADGAAEHRNPAFDPSRFEALLEG